MTAFTIPVPLHRLYLFPLVAGTSWFLTLAALLMTWIAKGTPRYPGQQNPYVAFISDIAAFQLKPLFLIGAILTSISFICTLIAVHSSRYHPRMYGINDTPFKKRLSILAMTSGVIAGCALTLLAIFDTWRFHAEHAVLLLICFVGLVVSMVVTTMVYWEQAWRPTPFRRLRAFCIASATTVFVDFCIGVAFYTFLRAGYWRMAGFLEWTMAFTGAFYLWAFVGFVSVPEEGIDEEERRALLRHQME